MKRWLASPVRSGYYKSASFTAFSKSHVYLKLQDRKKDFESALGFGLDEQRLAELAGGATALALYDIGKIELVFVTEVSRARAAAMTMFKQASTFEERSAGGTSYYVREVSTDGGRLIQQFCFAHIEGRLIVTTAESLMLRALANTKSQTADSLAPAVIKAAESAEGFTAHDVTMFLDQAQLNGNRLFMSYWIHDNLRELAAIESGLVDLRISAEGLEEQRWFKLKKADSAGADVAGEELAGLSAFAPPGTQMIQVRANASGEILAAEASDALFGALPVDQEHAQAVGGPPSYADSSASSERVSRYSHLDSRFDLDVDDPDAPGRGAVATTSQAGYSSDFNKRLGAMLGAGGAKTYTALARSRTGTTKPFVGFEHALVIALSPETRVDRSALEQMISDELRARFVVGGPADQFRWEDDGEARFVAQSLLERGAAYGISGRYLVLASSKDFAKEILNAGTAARPARDGAAQPVRSYTLLRIAEAKPAFDLLTSKLDRSRPGGFTDPGDSTNPDRKINFFSENVSSLVGALGFRQVEFRQRAGGDQLRERAVYLW
jgi:hypothetical protein